MATPLTRTKIDEKSIMERKKKRKETTSKKRSSRRLPQRRVLDSAAIVIRRLCGFANGKIRRKVHGFPPGYDGDYSRGFERYSPSRNNRGVWKGFRRFMIVFPSPLLLREIHFLFSSFSVRCLKEEKKSEAKKRACECSQQGDTKVHWIA